ncbi:hypothetical protein S101446_03282 (plasmid) [Komagataeibacter europaeus]|nr:hypothetical protein S101446_03282 [Komagataeibacter europaeus]
MCALKTDFGPRATLEGAIVELIPRLQSIHYMIAHLGNCWANVRRYKWWRRSVSVWRWRWHRSCSADCRAMESLRRKPLRRPFFELAGQTADGWSSI